MFTTIDEAAVVFSVLTYEDGLREEPPFAWEAGGEAGEGDAVPNVELVREAARVANMGVTINNGLFAWSEALVAAFDNPFEEMPSTAEEAVLLLNHECTAIGGVSVSGSMSVPFVTSGLDTLPTDLQAQVRAAEALLSFVQASAPPLALHGQLSALMKRMRSPLAATVKEGVAQALAFLKALADRFDRLSVACRSKPSAPSTIPSAPSSILAAPPLTTRSQGPKRADSAPTTTRAQGKRRRT
jgi:hypothetical protein